jgi:hypothetical protein
LQYWAVLVSQNYPMKPISENEAKRMGLRRVAPCSCPSWTAPEAPFWNTFDKFIHFVDSLKT